MNRKSVKQVLKTIATICISAALFSSMSVAGVGADTDSYIKGDITGNGVVDLSDLTYLSSFLKGYYDCLNFKMSERLDVNSDGVINKKDCNDLISYLFSSDEIVNYSFTRRENLHMEPKQYVKFDASNGNEINLYTLQTYNLPYIPTDRSIFGTDDRFVDNGVKGVVNIGDNGSGIVVDSHTILTAAHCVYDTGTNQPARNLWYKLCDENGSFGERHYAEYFHVPKEFINYSSYDCIGDYAIITVEEDLSDYIMDVGISKYTLQDLNPEIFVSGLGFGFNGNGSVNVVTDSGRLTGDKIDLDCLYYNADTAGGESGGPVYIKDSNNDITVIGIHVCGGNIGVRLNTTIIRFIYNNPNL